MVEQECIENLRCFYKEKPVVSQAFLKSFGKNWSFHNTLITNTEPLLPIVHPSC